MSDYLERIVDFCSSLLYTHPSAQKTLQYLDLRLPHSAQKEFDFGFFPIDRELDVLSKFAPKNFLIENGLFYEEMQAGEIQRTQLVPHFKHHSLVLPYRDVYGTIIALVGRCILTDSEIQLLNIPKYRNTVFKKSRHLFALYQAKTAILEQKHVYLVEGQFDAIQAHSKGARNVVALGSSSLTADQLCLLLRYTNDIRLLLDNDEAGRRGRERIEEKYGKYVKLTNYYVPAGYKDLDEFLKDAPLNVRLEDHLNK